MIILPYIPACPPTGLPPSLPGYQTQLHANSSITLPTYLPTYLPSVPNHLPHYQPPLILTLPTSLSVIPAGFISRPVVHVDVIIGNPFRALRCRLLVRRYTCVNPHPVTLTRHGSY